MTGKPRTGEPSSGEPGTEQSTTAASVPAPSRPEPPEAASPAMAARIAAAWREGSLLLPRDARGDAPRLPGVHKSALPTSLGGEARVSLAGVGETFAAWRVSPPAHPPVMVRVPHVDPSALPQPLTHEVAALTLIPPEVGPEPIAVHDDLATSPLGRPAVVTSEVPGTAAAPETWTGAHLRAHARLLARLHTVPAPGRGPVHLGEEPWGSLPVGPPSLLDEVEEVIAGWEDAAAAEIAEHRLAPFLDAAREQVARIEPQIRALDGFVLAHGDLCATNILWRRGTGPDPLTVQFIDFEWAQGDDPARDLAILGGAVHGGPWFVPMDAAQQDAFVQEYVQARRELAEQAGREAPASVTEIAALQERIAAWTAYDRAAMLLHLATRLDGASPQAARNREAFGRLRSTLSVHLGIED